MSWIIETKAVEDSYEGDALADSIAALDGVESWLTLRYGSDLPMRDLRYLPHFPAVGRLCGYWPITRDGTRGDVRFRVGRGDYGFGLLRREASTFREHIYCEPAVATRLTIMFGVLVSHEWHKVLTWGNQEYIRSADVISAEQIQYLKAQHPDVYAALNPAREVPQLPSWKRWKQRVAERREAKRQADREAQLNNLAEESKITLYAKWKDTLKEREAVRS